MELLDSAKTSGEVSDFDAYPMPRVDDLIERLGPARKLTTMDLAKGYWQV